MAFHNVATSSVSTPSATLRVANRVGNSEHYQGHMDSITVPATQQQSQRVATSREIARKLQYLSMWVNGHNEQIAALKDALAAHQKLLKIYRATPKDLRQEIEASLPPEVRRGIRRALA